MELPQLTPPQDKTQLLWSQDESLARLFAASTNFQKEVGTEGDVAATLNHVLDWAAVDPEDDFFSRSRVLIEYANANRTLAGTWTSTGSLSVCFERKQPKHEDTSAGYRAAKAQFMRFLSSVLAEIEERSKNATQPILGFNPRRFGSYDLIGGPQCVPASEVHQAEDGADFCLWYIDLNFALS